MSNVVRRSNSGLSRAQKERRAYKLAVTGGGASAATVVLLLLAVIGIGSFGLPVITALLAGGAFYGMKRTVS
jgi:hypothetical protein